MRSTLVLAAALTWLASLLGCKHAAPRPLQQVCIYYGWPSVAGGARSTVEASALLGGFDVVVLGAGLEQPGHPDHGRTREIIARLREARPGLEIYGYLSLGPAGGGADALAIAIRAWHELGVHGIFFDEAGYDFGTTRARQAGAFQAARALGLRCFANAFDPDDLFSGRRDPRSNPGGEPCALERADAYLYESFVVRLGRPEEDEARRRKMEKLEVARRRGVRLFGVTTSAPEQAIDPRLWEKARREARRLVLDGLGFGQPGFGATDGRLPPGDRAP